MDWDGIKAWRDYRIRVKEQWRELTDGDLDQIEWSFEALSGRLQNRYGLSKGQAERQIEDWMQRWLLVALA